MKGLKAAYILSQVTTQQADAADETAISGVCELALREEGRLDVFFANVSVFFSICFGFTNVARNQAGIASKDALADTSVETFMNVMRVNTLSYVRGFFRSRTSTFKPHLVVFLQ